MRVVGIFMVAVLALIGVAGCEPVADPPPSVGHDREHAGEPDPPAPQPTPSETVSLRFTVYTTVEAAVTWNAGHGNKFIDSMAANGTRGESWMIGSSKGARLYLGAVPAKRGTQGTISVKIENAATGKLICHDTNFGNTRSGADCHGRAG